MRALLICAWLLAGLRAQAAIGDDLSKLRAEYGSASQVGNQMLFKHDGYSIAVYFDGTRSGMEIFVRDDPKKKDITQDDVDHLLALQSAGQTWNPVRTRSGQPTWVRLDGKVLARFNPTEKIFTVMANAK